MLEHIARFIKQNSKGMYLGGTYLISSRRFYITVHSQECDGEYIHTIISIVDPVRNAKEKNAPEEVMEHASNNINQLMDEAADQICTRITENTKSYIVEDCKGIHKLKVDETTERIIFYHYGYHYKHIYEQVAKPLIGASKRYSAMNFYERMAIDHDSISVQDALEYLKLHPEEFTKTEREKHDPNDPVVSITHLDITRRTGNKDKKTFDFVSVEILLRSNLNISDMRDYVRDNLEVLNQKALDKIASAKRYQSFGVPVSFLTLYSIGIHLQSTIRMMYELREVGLTAPDEDG